METVKLHFIGKDENQSLIIKANSKFVKETMYQFIETYIIVRKMKLTDAEKKIIDYVIENGTHVEADYQSLGKILDIKKRTFFRVRKRLCNWGLFFYNGKELITGKRFSTIYRTIQ